MRNQIASIGINQSEETYLLAPKSLYKGEPLFIFGILSTNPTTCLKQDCYLFCLAKIGFKPHVPRKTKWWAVVLVVVGLILSIHSHCTHLVSAVRNVHHPFNFFAGGTWQHHHLEHESPAKCSWPHSPKWHLMDPKIYLRSK